MIKSRQITGRKGAALLLTLWCVAILSVTIVLIARIVESDVDTESLRSRRFEARELALTGLAYGMNPSLKKDSELFHQKFPDGSSLDVRIISEGARPNINLLLKEKDRHTLKNLFRIWDVSDEDSRVAIDSLVDWTDPDSLRQLNGAEREDLLNQTKYSLPKNRDFRAVEEMKRVRGMDAVAMAQPSWKDFFSVFSSNKLDIQDAAPDILQAVAGFTREQAVDLQKWRNGADELEGTDDDHIIKKLGEVTAKLGLQEPQQAALEAAFQVGGEPSRIVSTARVGGSQYQISVVLDRRKAGKGYLLWEEK